jgi:predicted RNA-binding protein with RPS1 domain
MDTVKVKDKLFGLYITEEKILSRVKELATELNREYEGTVVRIMQFGAFVEVAPNKEGMIHISKLSNKRVEKVEDVVKIGDTVEVEVIKIDEKGRIDLEYYEILKAAEAEIKEVEAKIQKWEFGKREYMLILTATEKLMNKIF